MTSGDGLADGVEHPLSWSTPTEAAGLMIRGATARTATPIAAVVGTVLSFVNEGQVVVSGLAGVATWIRIGINYAIPFVVASIGYLSPLRIRDQGQVRASNGRNAPFPAPRSDAPIGPTDP